MSYEVRGVYKTYRQRAGLLAQGDAVEALRDVSLDVTAGESFGIVGESGSGKSTLVRLLLALERPDRGSVRFRDMELSNAREAGLRGFRREVQPVFQDPAGSLDPRMKVGAIVAEPLRSLGIAGDRRARALEMLEAVGLPASAATRYPHEFSGGQRQRIAIARALAPRPTVLIADEPVSALDLSVRAQILNLLRDLRRQLQLTLVLVSHDLSVVRYMCDDVAVLYRGEVVEAAPATRLFAHPKQDYTRALLAAVPRLRVAS